MKRIAALLIAICLVFTACKVNIVDRTRSEQRLMQTSRDWSRVAATDSLDKILSYWADDAVVMSPGQPPIKGKAAIRAMLESTSKIPGFKISWEPLSVVLSENADMGYLIEQNQVTMNDSTGKPVTEFNKCVTIWKKQADGSWKNVVDMWNADPSQQK